MWPFTKDEDDREVVIMLGLPVETAEVIQAVLKACNTSEEALDKLIGEDFSRLQVEEFHTVLKDLETSLGEAIVEIEDVLKNTNNKNLH